MSDLILTILCSTGIFVTFKQLSRYKTDVLNVIVINYLVATSLGLWLSPANISVKGVLASSWLPMSGIIGFLFILNFFLIGLSSAKAGISATTVASKMSMVVPIFFSMFFFHEKVSLIKIVGTILACMAVIFTIMKGKSFKLGSMKWLLPIALFFGTGITDATIKYAQHHYVANEDTSQFSFFLFMAAAIIAIVVSILRRSSIKSFLKTPILLGGFVLGIVNFCSLYYFIRALNNSGIDSSVIFGVAHISIVSLSVLAGMFLFREQLSRINWIGVILSLISIFILLNFS